MTMMTTKQFNAKASMYYEVQILNMINLSAVSGTARCHPYFNTFNGKWNSLSQHATTMVDARGEEMYKHLLQSPHFHNTLRVNFPEDFNLQAM
jgi:hypothetical protein